MAFALSQVFVISVLDANVGNEPRAMAAWLDMPGQQAIGNCRSALENVSLHPLMGFYLLHIRNRKADANTGRIPEQNFPRESMQLFSLGVLQFNPDGTPDVTGLSQVSTGSSYSCKAQNSRCFSNGATGGVGDPERFFKPMIAYPAFHSNEAKSFLGVTIAPQAVADPAVSLCGRWTRWPRTPTSTPFWGSRSSSAWSPATRARPLRETWLPSSTTTAPVCAAT